jgi:hypothetical protein
MRGTSSATLHQRTSQRVALYWRVPRADHGKEPGPVCDPAPHSHLTERRKQEVCTRVMGEPGSVGLDAKTIEPGATAPCSNYLLVPLCR